MEHYFSWILSFHIISFISWMAMLFYLPRLFVNHVENIEKKEFIGVIKHMERKLYKIIGVPAMWATILSGSAMLYIHSDVFSQGGWMHAKLTIVLLLIVYSFSLNFFRIKLEKDECVKSGKYFRFYNEIPTILSIFIIIMVVIRPF